MARLTTRLQVMVAPEQDAFLAQLAEQTGWSKADLVRHFLPLGPPADPGDYRELVMELRAINEAELDALIEGAEATGSESPGEEG